MSASILIFAKQIEKERQKRKKKGERERKKRSKSRRNASSFNDLSIRPSLRLFAPFSVREGQGKKYRAKASEEEEEEGDHITLEASFRSPIPVLRASSIHPFIRQENEMILPFTPLPSLEWILHPSIPIILLFSRESALDQGSSEPELPRDSVSIHPSIVRTSFSDVQ